MKSKRFFLPLFLSLLLAGCNNSERSSKTLVMDDVSLTCSGINFTKAVNHAKECYSIQDNRLVMNAGTGTNYFISPDGSRFEATAPILLTKVDNTKPFTFTTRLDNKVEKIYDAGTVYVFVDHENWLKFAFELDEKHRRRAVTVRTENSSDDNNHDIIEQDFIYMRISSNVKQIGYYYSLDGIDWNLARIYKNEYPAGLWIGLSSQSPKEGSNIACFSEMSLTDKYISHHRLGN